MSRSRISRLGRPLMTAVCAVLMLTLGGCVWFGKKSPGAPRAHFKGIEMTARLEPLPLKLSDTRRLTVILNLKNRSSRYVRLEFPTTQRMEVTARDARGHQFLVWSEDQAFENAPCSVGINPGEHLEYRAVIGTRDFVAGKRHVLTASIVGYPALTLELPITPEM